VTFDGRRPPDIDLDEDVCDVCGLVYKKFRTGLTYKDVYSMHWTTSNDSRDWRYKRRRTVLGKWREIKTAMWIEHLSTCAYFDRGEPEDA